MGQRLGGWVGRLGGCAGRLGDARARAGVEAREVGKMCELGGLGSWEACVGVWELMQ